MASLFIIESNDWDLHEFGSLMEGSADTDLNALRGEFLAQYEIPHGDDDHWFSDDPAQKAAHEKYQAASALAAKRLCDDGFRHPYHLKWPDGLRVSNQREWMPAFIWWLFNRRGFTRRPVFRFDFNAPSDSPYCLTRE